MTEEYKTQMREWLQTLFSQRESVLFSPTSIRDDVYYSEVLNLICVPVLMGKEFFEFFEEEGFFITDLKFAYKVSISS